MFTSIQEAVNAAPQLDDVTGMWTIRIKPGIYRELIYVMREKRFIRLVGEDPTTTLIAGSLFAGMRGPDGRPIGTFRTPTVWIDADDFSVQGIGIVNEAGPVGQAIALRLDGDRITLRDCHVRGWHNTVLSNRGRHYFEGCLITGAVDLVFGGGTAYFLRCDIACGGDGCITAASTPCDEDQGFVFAHCRVRGTEPGIRTYLGRPWRSFAAVAFIHTEMSDIVRGEGWHNADRPDREHTARFAEHDNRGPGSGLAQRATWVRALTSDEAHDLTPERVLAGRDGWTPAAR